MCVCVCEYSLVFHMILGINCDYFPIILCNRHAMFSVMKKLIFFFHFKLCLQILYIP